MKKKSWAMYRRINEMGRVRKVFDVKQYPHREGTIGDLEKRVEAMERRFAEIYAKDTIDGFMGFRTEQGTRFLVNAIYEWNAVLLEYDDGEDGDIISIEHDEEAMFKEFNDEILIGELDDRMNLERTYRIFKSESDGNTTTIYFRFPDGITGLQRLLTEYPKVIIDDVKYGFQAISEHQAVAVTALFERDLRDYWIKFTK